LTLVIFSPNEEMGGGLPLERVSATSWLHDGLVLMYVHTLKDSLPRDVHTYPTPRPGFGEELIMIAFWESEMEGRKVFYHLITTEDTGEDVFVISAAYDYCLFWV
jgi:hypothetical protein